MHVIATAVDREDPDDLAGRNRGGASAGRFHAREPHMPGGHNLAAVQPPSR